MAQTDPYNYAAAAYRYVDKRVGGAQRQWDSVNHTLALAAETAENNRKYHGAYGDIYSRRDNHSAGFTAGRLDGLRSAWAIETPERSKSFLHKWRYNRKKLETRELAISLEREIVKERGVFR